MMTSKISVEIDYTQNGRPYFRVVEAASSDDLRDKAITEFRNQLLQTSSWCKIEFKQVDMNGALHWYIYPIPPHELEEHIPQMQSIIADINQDGTITKEN